VGDPVELLKGAQKAIGENPTDAGKLFRQARIAFDQSNHTSSELYNMAALGEARWSDEVDASTYDALDKLRKNLWEIEDKNARDEQLRYERLVRATAYFRTDNPDAAMDVLGEITQIDSPNDGTTVMALMSKADIYMSKGFRASHEAREAHFRAARDILLEELPALMELMEKKVDSSQLSELDEFKKIVAELYAHSAEFFKDTHYHLYSRDSLDHLLANYRGTPAAERVLNEREHPLSDHIDGGKLKPLDKLTPVQRLKVGALEAVYNMRFPTQSQYWRMAIGSGLLTVSVDLFLQALTGNKLEFADTFHREVHVMGAGSAAGVAGTKLILGGTSPEAKQAYHAGYTDRKSWVKMGSGELLKVMGTYAFFGGVLPGIGLLNDNKVGNFVMAHADGHWGQLHGPGSGLAALSWGLGHHGGEAFRQMMEHGMSAGWDKFWHNFSTTTVLGSSLQNGKDWWENKLNYAVTNLPGDAYRAFMKMISFKDPVDSIVRFYQMAAGTYATSLMVRPQIRDWLYKRYGKWVPRAELAFLASGLAFGGVAGKLQSVYETMSGLYALTMMARPKLRETMLRQSRKLPLIEKAMLPGAYLLATDINMALGVKQWRGIYFIPVLGMLTQLRHHIMSGGRANNIDYAAVMRASLVPTLYTGSGAAMKADKALNDGSLGALMENSMGIQFWLYPIGFVHAMLAGLDLEEQAKIKAAKSWLHEYIGNSGRLALGWATLEGTAWSMIFQQLSGQPWAQSKYKEASGTPSQLTAFQKNITPETAAMSDQELAAHVGEVISSMDAPPPLAAGLGSVGAVSSAEMLDDDLIHVAKLKNEAIELKQRALEARVNWNFWREYKEASNEDKLGMLISLYYINKRNGLFPARPEVKYYYRQDDGLYGVLTDPETSEDAISKFLDDLKLIAKDLDPNKNGMRSDLVLAAWAATKGPHEGMIRDFFRSNDWMLKAFVSAKKDMIKPIGFNSRLAKKLLAPVNGKVEDLKGVRRWLFDMFVDPAKIRTKVSAPSDWWPWISRRRWFNNRKLGDKAAKLEGASVAAGTSWSFWNFLTGETLTERAPMFTSLYFTAKRKDVAFPTGFQEKYFRKAVFKTLMDPETPPGYIAEHLRLLREIARDVDPVRRNIRHNLILSTWAARKGHHGKMIRDFFYENDWVLGYYQISNDKPPETHRTYAGGLKPWFKRRISGVYSKVRSVATLGFAEKLPENHWSNKWKNEYGPRGWFNQNLKGGDNSTDGKVRDKGGIVKRLWGRVKGLFEGKKK
jgi:hypothetical protein